MRSIKNVILRLDRGIQFLIVLLVFILLSSTLFAADIELPFQTYQSTVQTTGRQALVFSASDTEKILTINANGLTHTIIVELPDWTVDRTATLSLLNSDSKTLYSISALAENATYILLVERPFHGTNTFKITLSGAPGGSGGTAYVTVYKK